MDLHQERATAPPGHGPRTTGADVSDLGHLTLPAGPTVPSAARTAVGGWIDGLVPAEVVRDVQLLISELVTNSFRHGGAAGTPLRIAAGTDGSDLWFEVDDAGPDGAVARRDPSSGLGGGFGLHLVNALASAWGVTHVKGTQVWFTLPLGPAVGP
jgi:anti-sigma regulatory factor (Ser/Thr protein kinase)